MDFGQRHSLYPRKLGLVPEVEECTNAILGVKVAVILNESKSVVNVSSAARNSIELATEHGCSTLCKYC